MPKITKSTIVPFVLIFLYLFTLPAHAEYNGGTGDPCDPYQINDPCQLNAVGTDPNDWDKHFILTADIDLSQYTREQFNIIAPDIANYESGFQGTKFTGSFDGNGHVINNFAYFTYTDFIGLFGSLGTGGEIKKLGMINVSVRGDDYLGGLVGNNYYGSISNCYATGSISGDDRLGGLVGNNYYGSISNCCATGSVSGGDESYYLGALVGMNHSGSINNCCATCSVSGGDRSCYLGGLVGRNYYSGSISNCYATGDVNGVGNSNHLGGLVGHNGWNNSVSDCYATGNVVGGDYSSKLGGLVGNNDGSISNSYATGSVSGGDYSYYLGGLAGLEYGGSITSCFWDIKTSGMSTSAGGTGLTTAQMQDINTFLNAGWDFVDEIANGTEDIWRMPLGWYPALAWQTLVTIPDIAGMNQTEAQNTIIEAGLSIGKINSIRSSTIPVGIIMDQFPPPGIIIGEQSPVNIMVSIGPSPYAGGSGTESDPFQIATADQLEILSNCPSDYDLHFILTDNIDLSGRTYTTALIGPDPNFTGSFDGAGYMIINLTIDTSWVRYLGLFGKIGTGGVIKNLGLENATIIGGNYSDQLGALAGYNNGIITNCYATGSISGNDHIGGLVGKNYSIISDCYAIGSVSGDDYIGGLVGYDHYGNITNCYAIGSVSGEDYSDYLGTNYLGGLVGKNYGIISNSYATGSVSGDDKLGGLVGKNSGSISNCYSIGGISGDDRLGGLVGENYHGSITNCYAIGSVSGRKYSDYLGGLVGYNGYGSISDCYATGVVNGGNDYIGGLVGDNYRGSISNSFWDMDTSGMLTSDGGTGKTMVQMQTQSTFTNAGWDFVGEDINGMVDIWRMCVDGIDYPKLSWQFLAGDFTCPDGVEFNDLMYMLEYWLENDCPGTPGCPRADINADNQINLKDFTHLAANWLLY